MTAKATTTRAATTRAATTTTRKPAAKPAPKAAAKKAAPKRVTGGTFDASGVETHKCAGKCRQTLPVRKFPTITGTPNRVAECRSCRNARTAAAKEAKA